MKRFCKECGHEASEEHKVCGNCGKPLYEEQPIIEESVSEELETSESVGKEPVTKNPMTKKNKLILSSVIGILVVCIGMHLWAKSYTSLESVEKRFEDAITAQDSKKVMKLTIHEDGTSISEHEAKAFANLVKTGGNAHLNDLTNIVPDGKFLGLYDSYKVEVFDQFATYDNFVEGLSFEFNGEEFPIYKKEEDSITYGPLAPGEYTVQANFESDSGETSLEDTLIVASTYGEHTWIDMDIPISMVRFYVENHYEFDTTDAFIQLNDEQYPIDEYGETVEVGPFVIDGSQDINIVVHMPWGEITSEDISVDDSYMYMYADLISPDQYKEVTEVLTSFGDEYLHALANKTTKSLVMLTDNLKDNIADTFNEDTYFTGQFEELHIDKNSISVDASGDQPQIKIDARYMIKDDVHDLSHPPELDNNEYEWNMSLVYNDENKEWLIDAYMYTDIWAEESELEVIAGSETLHGPNEDSVKAAQTNSLEEEIEGFVIEYTKASVNAINERSFNTVSQYITEDGPRREEASEYIDYLDSKDIFEEWYGTELESLEEIDDTSWKVTIIEEFDIIKPDSSNVKEFRTVLVIKMIDDDYYVDELLETNEI